MSSPEGVGLAITGSFVWDRMAWLMNGDNWSSKQCLISNCLVHIGLVMYGSTCLQYMYTCMDVYIITCL